MSRCRRINLCTWINFSNRYPSRKRGLVDTGRPGEKYHFGVLGKNRYQTLDLRLRHPFDELVYYLERFVKLGQFDSRASSKAPLCTNLFLVLLLLLGGNKALRRHHKLVLCRSLVLARENICRNIDANECHSTNSEFLYKNSGYYLNF